MRISYWLFIVLLHMLTFGISSFYLAFCINRDCAEHILGRGYVPATEKDVQILSTMGLVEASKFLNQENKEEQVA